MLLKNNIIYNESFVFKKLVYNFVRFENYDDITIYQLIFFIDLKLALIFFLNQFCLF